MANRLANETSPYLFQHRDNPVDWYPWGDEAFELARKQDKPIFLSVGYSACHWCHVMAHESFEDEETAAYLNDNFVSIKVDREERPDVDSIYMNAVQALSGSGGWPMSVWLLPDGRPFFGGTYFPPTARHGMPSFKDLLQRIADAYSNQREGLERDAGRLTQAINRTVPLANGESLPGWEVLEAAFQKIAASFDAEWGGFGSQPKFPPSMTIDLLFRLYNHFGWQAALDMGTHTLNRMMQGGMYDQLGGGFHRYSVDRQWLVPHFEKMLYDNALLIRAYLAAFQITGESKYRRVAEQTVAYVQREMLDETGGFYSAQDADSEGHEGKYFVWSEDELRRILDKEVNTDLVLDYWGVVLGPNFEGRSILWTPKDAQSVAERHGTSVTTLEEEINKARTILFAERETRVKPGLDDKVLTAWNGLMIHSLAEAGRILERSDYVSLAAKAAIFVLENLREEGRLLRSYKDGAAKFNAYLEDYAFMVEGLLALYEVTFELHWFTEAHSLTEMMVSLFWDDRAGFFDTSADHEALIMRPQELTDNAIPSGTSSAVAVLVRMAILGDRPDWRAKADRIFARMAPAIEAYPSAFSYLTSQLAFVLAPPHEVALVGESGADDLNQLLRIMNDAYRPAQVVALLQPDQREAASHIRLLANREKRDGTATAYVCKNYVCRMPIVDPNLLRQELDRTASV